MHAQKHETPGGGGGRPDPAATRRRAPALIGIGVDGTEGGRDAVVLGAMLGRANRAELMLIAVHEEPLVPLVLPPGMDWKDQQQQSSAMLAETRDSLAPGARTVVEADVLVWRGLRQVVRREHRDLLVMGSGRHAKDGQVQLGKSASDIMAHLECPLAIAPRGMRNRENPRLRRIGVGFDDTPESEAALKLAGSLAVAADARLEVCGVVDDRVPGGLTTEEITLDGKALVETRLASLSERAVAGARATGAQAEIDVSPGIPTGILSRLRDRVDLLVIGSGSSGPPGRVILGSTGRALFDGAPCPTAVAARPGS